MTIHSIALILSIFAAAACQAGLTMTSQVEPFALGTPFPGAALSAHFSAQPQTMTASRLWIRSEHQIAELEAQVQNGSMGAAQAASFTAEIRAIRARHGVSRKSDLSKLRREQRRLLLRDLDGQAEKINKFNAATKLK